ncbi:MAG: FkbM family methyltransferase [Pirellulales bacterium]
MRRPLSRRPEAWRACRLSYSHFGEDLIICDLLSSLGRTRQGIYVDVGTFHPYLHSNTYLLHMQGRQGLNIDASPRRMAEFQKHRPNDANIVAAIAAQVGEMDFLEFPTAGTSRLAPIGAATSRNSAGESPLSVTRVKTLPIRNLIDQHAPQDTPIDLLSIDVEGLDLDVLQSWNWNRRPALIAVEGNSHQERQRLRDYVIAKGYREIACCVVTLIFIAIEFDPAESRQA